MFGEGEYEREVEMREFSTRSISISQDLHPHPHRSTSRFPGIIDQSNPAASATAVRRRVEKSILRTSTLCPFVNHSIIVS